ncbi:diacylglycerol O-acyltransferase 1 [Eurytemora carolleeae]|uniref:diacylglycerol O-acyltransferase 1 n=1 Tax=Eurytemora carolleeae TaxID=1294199 RepID=UPI000C789671|nr:diacylglycerol O-acyltransferase 1 [Eurytemora carolleeae]|eukprot:XP_023344418.1 diacylglycerol O-acyltransferase 1-like [Eurytemora affinis]
MTEGESRMRLRRTNSTSRAEDIVTEDAKVRKSQPDKPIHSPRDSLISWGSTFNNFEGMVNWAFLLLVMGGLRLCLENLNKYGVRVNPNSIITAFLNHVTDENASFISFYLLLYTNVPILLILLVEKLIVKDIITWRMGCFVHMTNLLLMLLIPILVINVRSEDIGVLAATVTTAVYSILFLKMWSYIQVNHWCRCSITILGQKRARHTSIYRQASIIMDKNLYKASSPKSLADEKEAIKEKGNTDSIGLKPVTWPDNLSLRDIYYFWFAPTLCYELNFPRASRIRKLFLLRRGLEVVIVSSLAIPNHLLWLIWFYLLFHSFLNSIGEILQFADRDFYHDWWNANNIAKFWSTWNLPVHRWCVRHLYKPLLHAGCSKTTGMLVVFFTSAFFHEYLISVPLRVFKIWAFLGMMVQAPLFPFTRFIQKRVGPRMGNIMVWVSLILGQPLAVMMYYHDFVVEHFGRDLITAYGEINSFNTSQPIII